jgi:hypothetical protein
MFEYRQVILQMRSGESDRAISRLGWVSRTKAQEIRVIAKKAGWLDTQQELPGDEALALLLHKKSTRKSNESLSLAYQKEVAEWISQGIQITTIHQTLIQKYQFAGSYSSIQRLAKNIGNKKINASTVLDFAPGESAQIDFGQGPEITDVFTGEAFKTWIFVMVLSWSRHQYAEIVKHQNVETWLGCHRRAFEFFNGVPARTIIDNPKCAITKACYYDPQVQKAYGECAEAYGFMISPCPPREPKKKGRVESGVKYVKKNFVPLKTFRTLADANEQLKKWVLETAGNRTHGSTYEKPLNRFNETEKYVLKPLPNQAPELSVWQTVKVHGDCHVQFEKCRYSVPYSFVNQSLWLRASESTVRIYQEHAIIAIHPRLRKIGSRHTLDEHLPPNGLAYTMRDPQWCLKQAKEIGVHCHQVIEALFNDKVLDRLRAAQGILSLKKTYNAARLEAACRRALAFNAINYSSIKNILKRGIEYEALPDEAAFENLADSYRGRGQYYRDTKTILQ